MNAFREVISIEPKFPFAYYYLAYCKKALHDTTWEDDMSVALKIFEKTVKVAGHNENHDQALQDIHERFGL